ncbi:MAG: hypothetical protein ABSH25_10185 [Syntrophorhabdales bacterium]|jgi:hypothetical protein
MISQNRIVADPDEQNLVGIPLKGIDGNQWPHCKVFVAALFSER